MLYAGQSARSGEQNVSWRNRGRQTGRQYQSINHITLKQTININQSINHSLSHNQSITRNQSIYNINHSRSTLLVNQSQQISFIHFQSIFINRPIICQAISEKFKSNSSLIILLIIQLIIVFNHKITSDWSLISPSRTKIPAQKVTLLTSPEIYIAWDWFTLKSGTK